MKFSLLIVICFLLLPISARGQAEICKSGNGLTCEQQSINLESVQSTLNLNPDSTERINLQFSDCPCLNLKNVGLKIKGQVLSNYHLTGLDFNIPIVLGSPSLNNNRIPVIKNSFLPVGTLKLRYSMNPLAEPYQWSNKPRPIVLGVIVQGKSLLDVNKLIYSLTPKD